MVDSDRVDAEEVREQAERQHGARGTSWAAMAELDPGFLAAYLRLARVPVEHGRLDPVTRELVRLAVDANATHLYLPAIPGDIDRALAAGATPAEVMEVLECAATLGIHAANIGVPILVEVLRELGVYEEPGELDERRERLKADFVRNRGYWHDFWEELLELDPEFFEAYTDFSSVPWRTGSLLPKVKEFIYISFDVAATHLYVPGLRLHIRNAIGYGATAGEIVEVIELASTLGIHAVEVGAPMLIARLRDGAADAAHSLSSADSSDDRAR